MTKTVSVYFNGTDDSKHIPEYGNYVALAALLDQMTIKNNDNFSLCVEGCGIETQDIRDLGIIFAFHLEKQVLKVAKQVEDMVKSNKEKIILNIYGFSRGGVAAFLLAQKLKHISADFLTINIASFEPVPGNFIMGVYGDLLLGVGSTLSAAVADLTECKNIANALVLFTNQPLPDIACHAPIFPAFPATCSMDLDVTPGCHRGAVVFNKSGDSIGAANNESVIVFHRIVEFMKKCGTSFDFKQFQLANNLVQDEKSSALLDMYNELARKTHTKDGGQKRSMHLRNVLFTAKDKKRYLNRYHQQLCGVKQINDGDCILSIENCNPQRMNSELRNAIQFMQLALMLAMVWMVYSKYWGEPALKSPSGPRF
jgi:hypothetical protein